MTTARSRWPLLAILALAVLLRVAYVLSLRGTPWFEHLVVDPEYYDEWARRIAAGDWMGDHPFYMDPLYPYVLAGLYRISGRDLLLARFLNVVFGAASCGLVGRIGVRVGGGAVGSLAALGFALYKPEIFYAGEIDKTCLSVFLTAATLALALGATLPARFAAGVVLGLAALTRANLLLLAPLGVLWVVMERPERPARAVAAAGLFGAGVALALLPVAWRNHHLSGEWVLTTAQAGQNFYTGNNALNPYGAYGALPFVRGNPHFEEADFRAEAERRVGRALGPEEVSRFWFGEAFRHMREQPAFAAGAFLRKLALFWNDFEISDNQDQYLLARESWVLRLPLPGFGAVAPFALLGALAALRARRSVWLLAAFVGVYCVSVVAFFIFSRYRIQIVPALLPLAALGALELAGWVRAGNWRRAAVGGGVVFAGGLLAFQTIDVFTPRNPQVVEMQLRHLSEAYLAAGQPERALAALEEAVATCPLRCRGALGDLADTFVKSDRAADGTAYFRRFTGEYPEHPDGARHLARLEAATRNR